MISFFLDVLIALRTLFYKARVCVNTHMNLFKVPEMRDVFDAIYNKENGMKGSGYIKCDKKLGPYCNNPQVVDENNAEKFKQNNPLISVHSLYKDAVLARGRSMLDIHYLLASYSFCEV